MFAFTLPSLPVFVPLIGAGLLALALTGRDFERTAVYMMVVGWALFAFSSPSSEFPQLLRPLGNGLFGLGAIVHYLSTKDRRPKLVGRKVALSTRMVVVYATFVLIGCVASPFGPKNLVRGVQGVLIIGTAFYGVSIGLTMQLLTGTFLAAAANTILTVLSRKQEVDNLGHPTGRLAGYMQPNHLAFTAAEVIVGVIWALPKDFRIKLPVYGVTRLKLALIVTGLIATYALYASESRTGWLAVVPAILIAWFATPSARGTRTKVVIYSVAALLVLAPLAGPAVGKYLSRDENAQGITSLTGRTDFWPLAVELIEERPIVGWGVNVILSPVGYKFQQVLAGVGQAHDAYLEAGLQSGLIGLAAFAVSLIALMVGSLRLPRDDELRMLVIAGSILTFIFAFTESSPAWFGDMFIVYVLCLAIYGDRIHRLPSGRPVVVKLPEPRAERV